MGNSGDKMENIIIIGAGPAGISAALYAARGNLTPLLLNNGIGALAKAEKIENYYGLDFFTEIIPVYISRNIQIFPVIHACSF